MFPNISWLEPVSWVSVFEAVGTVAAVFAAVFIATHEVRRANEDKHERLRRERQEQASYITSWVETKEISGRRWSTLHTRNASSRPIRVVNVYLEVLHEGKANLITTTAAMIMPDADYIFDAGETVVYPVDQHIPVMFDFYDANGVQWVKDVQGRLSEAPDGWNRFSDKVKYGHRALAPQPHDNFRDRLRRY